MIWQPELVGVRELKRSWPGGLHISSGVHSIARKMSRPGSSDRLIILLCTAVLAYIAYKTYGPQIHEFIQPYLPRKR